MTRRRITVRILTRTVEFRDILKRRRMVRATRPNKIPRESLDHIVATIQRAPSGGYSQGQRLVVVCAREEDYHERYRQPDKLDESGTEIEWPVPYWYVDAGKAAMLVLLAAIDEGLAAGVFGVPAERIGDFRGLLGLPDEVAVVEVITIGHAAEDSVSDQRSSRATRPRKSLGELVRWERWA